MMRIGFFEKFKGADTILIHGTQDELRVFAGLLESLAQPGATAVHLDTLSFVDARLETRVELCAVMNGRSVRRRDDEATGNSFVISQPAQHWLDDAELVQNVADWGDAHNWICDVGSLAVMVSCGEFYDEEWWKRHG